jgi:hypothetical protein
LLGFKQASVHVQTAQPPAKSARSVDDATGTGVEDVTVLREEQIALPEEVGETEDGLAEDGYQLFEAALVEIGMP